MPVFALVPLMCYVLLVLLSMRWLPRVGLPGDLASALVVSAIVICGYVVFVTEFVSVVGWLSTWPVAGTWVALMLALAWQWRKVYTKQTENPDASTQEAECVLPVLAEWRTCCFWLWMGAGFFVLLALLVALASPPNTHDSLAYHLPRQLRWIQMGRVGMFATGDMRELSFAPLSEYLQMHTMLLTSGDTLVNVPQWVAYALTVVSAALLCRVLGFVQAAPLAAVFAASQPMAYIQAGGSKNDPILMFLVVAFGWLAAEAMRNSRCGIAHSALMGGALGLAALAKTTAVVILFPLCLLVGVVMLWQHRAGAIWRGAIIASVAIVCLAGYTARNVQAFGHPLGPLKDADGGYSQSMETHRLDAIGSNLLRNLALHATLDTYEQAESVERFVRTLHERLGWDPDDPRTTWRMRYVGQKALDNEGRAPAPLHLVLGLLACVPLAWRVLRRVPGSRLTLAYWACGVLGFLLFVALLKWNPWHARLHAPIIALMAAPTAIGLTPQGKSMWRGLIACIVAAPVLAFVGWAAAINVDRPLLGPRGVLAHPGKDFLRWRTQHSREQTLAGVEGLWGLPEGPVAVLTGNEEYNVMRLIAASGGHQFFTHLNGRLGRTQKRDPHWKPPMAIVTCYHSMPAREIDGRSFVRVGRVSFMNTYVLADAEPPRSYGDSLPTLDRYSALLAPKTAGRMAGPHSYSNVPWALVLPSDGVDVPVPGDGEPRTLLVSLCPFGRSDSGVRITLGDSVLLDSPPLASKVFTPFEVAVPGIETPGLLRIRFPEAQAGGRSDAAAVGWMQMPAAAEVNAYDVRTRAK